MSTALPYKALKEDDLAIWRGLNVGVIYQSFNLLPMLNLRDNITLAMDFCGQYRPGKSEQKAMDLLDSVELAEHGTQAAGFHFRRAKAACGDSPGAGKRSAADPGR